MIEQETLRRKLPPAVRRERGTHAGLWLDKYIRNQQRDDTESRRELVNEVVDLPDPPEYTAFYRRWEAMLKKDGIQTRKVRVRGRMVVGDTMNAGYLTFFDALYIPGTGRYHGKALAPDIITVHHQKYYQDAEAVPSDGDDPNPIPFLSATGDYLLALGAPDFREPTRWVDLTFQILAEALEKLGIGAKTSSGYGRMTLLDAPTRPAHPELKMADGLIKGLDAMAHRDVAGQVHGYYQKWQLLTLQEARLLFAQAIVDKIEQAGRTKQTAEKAWYKDLQAFLSEHASSQGGN